MPKQKFTLCILAIIISLFIQLSFEQAFPQSVIREMATRKMRYHHYLWHQVREGWNRFPKATQDAFRNINWAPPRPARVYDSNGVSSPIYDNDSGEDFLYMHRQMIATANSIITRNRDPYGRIRGWTTIPGPGDRTFPVPPAYTVPNNPSTTSSSTNRKTDAFYTNSIQRYERMFKDPVQLRQWSLAEFGARMEVTIHGWIHMRWSSASAYGYRTSYRGTIPNIDKQWDDIRYDWLGDSYASHVHPIFWNIHGWVDDRIEDWRRANGLSTIRWKGTWTGGPMENLSSVMKTKGMDMDHMSSKNGAESGMDVLEKAFMILKQSGVPETSFADELAFEDFAPQDKKRVCRIRKAKL